VSEQDSTEGPRQEPAEPVKASSKWAWQPGEWPRLRLRVIAGAVTTVVVAGAAYGAGVLYTYEHGKADKDREQKMALRAQTGQAPSPALSSPAPPIATSPSPKPTPTVTLFQESTEPKAEKKQTAHETGAKGARRPTSPKLSTTRDVLLQNVMTGKCADVPGNGKGSSGGAVVQHTCRKTAEDNQRWDLVVAKKGGGPNGADLFTIRNSKDALCIDPPANGAPTPARVTERVCAQGGAGQRWYLDKKHTGQFWIRSTGSGGKCLDVEGARAEDASLTVFTCDPNDDHLWAFTPAN
jgi:hypothetical protein